jgi:hypothetical protein
MIDVCSHGMGVFSREIAKVWHYHPHLAARSGNLEVPEIAPVQVHYGQDRFQSSFQPVPPDRVCTVWR